MLEADPIFYSKPVGEHVSHRKVEFHGWVLVFEWNPAVKPNGEVRLASIERV